MKNPSKKQAKINTSKVGKVMREYKVGKLHSGSKSGPLVKNRAQALAIGLSEANRLLKKNK